MNTREKVRSSKARMWAAVGGILAAAAMTTAAVTPVKAADVAKQTKKPNILFILVDNLGYGELGCYGGGVTRGAPTPHIDRLAADGMRLLNMNMETQSTPSRSSIMTGRFSIRSGTYEVPFGGEAEGLTRWEVTVAQALSDAGYATALFGKWHLGSQDGRLPNDRGFDEWYGIPRTTDESMWMSHPQWSAKLAPPEQIMEGVKGKKSHAVKTYDVQQRRLIDAELTRRTTDFMKRQAKAGKPFFAFAALTQPHLPTLPNPAFTGRTGNGDWADMLAEMDHNVGQLLEAVDRLGIRNNTIVIFTSDNGAEFFQPWNGWAGPWRGSYFMALEGGIRVPFMIRWPGRIPAGVTSNEIVHGVDMFPTLARLTNAKVPSDRPMDGVDQSDFFLGKSEKSNRESFPIWCGNTLMAVKWRNWKMHFYRQETAFDPQQKNPGPMIYNLYTDPREEKPLPDTWVVYPMLKVVEEFQASVKKYPLIPAGTPDPYMPRSK